MKCRNAVMGGLNAFLFVLFALSFGTDVAAKQCSTDDIVVLAKQGFTKADIDKVCTSQPSSSTPAADLVAAFVSLAEGGSSDLGEALVAQGKWQLGRVVGQGTPSRPITGVFHGWEVDAGRDELMLLMKFAPQSNDVATRCSELKGVLSHIDKAATQAMQIRTFPFSDNGRGDVEYGSQQGKANIRGKFQATLSCNQGSVYRYPQGPRQMPASVYLALKKI